MDSSAGEPVIDALEGQRLGRYEIVERIGSGGMAVVYRALQPTLRRHVAIKVLPAYLAHEPGFLDRFQREAETVARLDHPNILPIYDFGREGDLPYIVMPLVTGGTLRDWLSGPVPLARALQAFQRILAALEYAHTRKPAIIHRDLKPSNILISQGDWPLLTDFGIAKIAESPLHLTGSGTIIGTPEYMSPEQSRGNTLDRRADVYGMGVLLFELLTGEVPYEGDSALDVILRHLSDPIPRPSEVRPELGPIWDEVIQRSMAKDPNERYPTALALEQAVEAAARQMRLDDVGAYLVGRVNLTELRDSAAQALAEGHYSRVISLCGQILAVDPGHQEAGRLLTQAQEKLMLRQRAAGPEEQARDLVRQGDAALAAQEYMTAREQFRAALRVAPELAEAQSGLRRLESILADLYRAARTDLAGGRWTDAAARLEQLAAAAPDDRRVASLREEVATETERQVRIAAWYERGQRAAARQDWAGAQAAYHRVVESAPSYRDAAARLAAVEQALAAAAAPPTDASSAPAAASLAAAPPSSAVVRPATPPPVVARTPTAARVYVTNRVAGSVTVIDAQRQTVVGTVPVGAGPLGIAAAPDGRHVYVANRGSNRLQVLEAASPTAVASVPISAGPYGVAVHPDGSRVYVTSHFGDSLVVVDVAGQRAVATIRVGRKPTGVAVATDGRRAYVACRDGNSVAVVDLERQAVVATITLPPRSSPEALAVAPDNSRVYVTAVDGGTLVVLDPASGTAVASVPVGSTPHSVAVHPGGRVYVTTTDSVVVVDPTGPAVVATIVVERWPRGIAIAPDGGHVYVAHRDSGNLRVLDATTHAVVAALPAGAGAVGVAVARG